MIKRSRSSNPINAKQDDFLLSCKPAAIFVRLTAASLLLLITIFYAETIATTLLPLYRMVFELIAGDFRILSLGISLENADRVIRLNVTLSHAIAVAGHLVMANSQGGASVTTMTGNIFQPVMVGLIAILAWPSRSWREVTLRLIILTLLSSMETIFDIPLLLAGELWGVLLDNLSPGSWSFLTVWADFLQGGGRLAIGVMAAITSIYGSGHAATFRNSSK
ncbi:hypothetical protein [Sideroxydans sp. CL21]|uniref:hypothetical protein n=1 Tax=Sideroxydans sp. CL21 TaxID=2600596 RepID=UPI0024BCE3AB|nr:hypothetical protein [Sideroxydans sp. CL21]